MAGNVHGAGDIVRLIERDGWRMQALFEVSTLALPDCWIGAGFVRNVVWDALHGYNRPTPLNDVDVLFFDRSDTSRSIERQFEVALARAMPGVPWNVRNQARMHLRNGDAPYQSVVDAMRFWVETVTGVAVRTGGDGRLELVAAHGLDDLVNLVVRPTARFARSLHVFEARMREKNWPAMWPRLTVRRF